MVARPCKIAAEVVRRFGMRVRQRARTFDDQAAFEVSDSLHDAPEAAFLVGVGGNQGGNGRESARPVP